MDGDRWLRHARSAPELPGLICLSALLFTVAFAGHAVIGNGRRRKAELIRIREAALLRPGQAGLVCRVVRAYTWQREEMARGISSRAMAAGGIGVTVYVYKLAGQRGKFWTLNYPDPWYGLTADDEEELHPFAESIGLYRNMYRPRLSGNEQTPLVGHYDLDQGERDQAVDKGARPITTRDHGKMLRRRAAELGITLT